MTLMTFSSSWGLKAKVTEMVYKKMHFSDGGVLISGLLSKQCRYY